MAELTRVAQAAIRSASLLRTALIPSQPCRQLARASSIAVRNYTSTTSSLCTPKRPARPMPTAAISPKTQRRAYASAWTDPTRATQKGTDNIAEIGIRRPNSFSYHLAFSNQKGEETDPVQFASDLMELDVTDIKQQPQSRAEAPSAPQAYLRMVPRTGRTVYVKNNVDVARSFKLLAQQVAQNGVRRDFYLQRFHERPGKKRKRLRSQRWERRFKKGFKATISRVRALTAQGW